MSSAPEVQNAHDSVVPKVIGADVELANFFVDDQAPAGQTAAQIQNASGDAARLLLAHIQGCPAGQSAGAIALTSSNYDAYPTASADYGNYYSAWAQGWTSDRDRPAYQEHAQDRGRKFLAANGSCAYIDLEHLELCTPETISAFDHVAAWHAMLRIARDALHRANAQLPPGRKVKLLANNSDGHGRSSWGSHLSVLVTRDCYENLFNRKMHHLQWLATCQCASLILTGAGKVGSENGHSPVPYNISSRADFVETLVGLQTTYHRPLCNTRDESLACDSDLARVHIIFYDSTLCHTSMLLRAGIMQIILAMCEQGQVPMCLLDDPVAAVHRFSRDPDLTARAAMANGDRYSAVELLEAIFEHAQQFVAEGRAQGLVPRVADIMAHWGACLQAFRRNDMDALAPKLDWVAKRLILRRAAERRGVAWDSPLIQCYDQLWASLDSREGLYFALERAGAVERLVSDTDIERFVHQPPADTRAWLRSAILSRAAPGTIDLVDWDTLRLRAEHANCYGWPEYHTLSMKDPLAFTRQQCEAILNAAPTLVEALDRIRVAQAEIRSLVNPETEFASPEISPVEDLPEDRSTPTLQGD